MKVELNRDLKRQIRQRNRGGAMTVRNDYLLDMADTLSSEPARTGRLYEWRKGSLRPISYGPARSRGRRLGASNVRRGRSVGRIHVASAPGEPPALLTGDLWRRRGGKNRRTQRGITVRFTSGVPYARRLEFGGGSIEPRPAWLPTWRQNRERYRASYREGWRRAA